MKGILRTAMKNIVSLKRPAENLSDIFTKRPEMPFAVDCKKCGKCSKACRTGAISIEDEWIVDIGKCILCGDCIESCDNDSLRMINAPDYSLTREGLVFRAGEPTDRPAELLGKRIRRTIGRSMNIREIDTGSCNACEVEVNALSNPFYDVERFGIRITASPRHADILLITGPVTKNMYSAMMKAVAATPNPKVIVAMGTCAISGGLFCDGETVGSGATESVHVNIFIPGCPPSPDRVIRTLLTAFGHGTTTTIQ